MEHITSKNLTDRIAALLKTAPNVARDLKRISSDKFAERSEGGITEVSLANAIYFVQKHGLPYSVRLSNPGSQPCVANHTVIAAWGTPDLGTFIFTGFGWGYGGSGAWGLMRLLILFGIRSGTQGEVGNEILSWPQTTGREWKMQPDGEWLGVGA